MVHEESAEVPNRAKMQTAFAVAQQSAVVWLASDEASEVKAELEQSPEAVEAVKDYFRGRLHGSDVLGEAMTFIVSGYFDEVRTSGSKFRQHPVTMIVRCDRGANFYFSDADFSHIFELREEHPSAFRWLRGLVERHSSFCRDALIEAFSAHNLLVTRRVKHFDKHYDVESWTADTPSSSHGGVEWSIKAPLSSVLTISEAECEIVLMRSTWESSIESEFSLLSRWRGLLAQRLENSARRIRGA